MRLAMGGVHVDRRMHGGSLLEVCIPMITWNAARL